MRADIHLLGGFSVVVDGREVPEEAWRRRQAALLVKLLALQPGHRMRREALIDALWPDLLLDEAAPRLHKAAFYARVVLDAPDGVVLSGATVSLLPEAEITVDVERFDAAVARSDALAAVSQYRGDLLPDDVYEPWTEEPRERRRVQYLGVLRELGRWKELLERDPLDEEAHLELVAEHLRAGDRQGALRLLDLMDQTFLRELGSEPSDAAQALRETAVAMSAVDPDQVVFRVGTMTPVPLPPTATIGRTEEIGRVLGLLDRARVVTLLGPGGVGKTRLALEVAARRREERAVDACFVDLTKVTDAALVPDVIARELGARLGGSAEQAVQEVLRGQALLLVLDNFEHVVEAAPVVSGIISWSPDVEVLATSRTRLRIDGEQVFDVAPLAAEPLPASMAEEEPPDAVRLFAQVARSVDPSFDLDVHREDVLAICRQVDGLPLAIELAAGHVRTLAPALLRARLGARLGSAEEAPRGRPPRQRTVAATIDWSLQLLGPAEAGLFARLGIFGAPVSLETVEHVCALDEETHAVAPLLGRLVDQSLVRRSPGVAGEPRFGLLELLRERARALLPEDERHELEARRAALVADELDLLDERRGTDAAGLWIDRIDEQLPEIRAAHAWAERAGDVPLAARIAAGLGTFWHREGHHEEGRQWVAASLEHLPELTTMTAARLHLAAGYLEWSQDPEAGRHHWSSAAALFRSLGHDRNLAYALALMCGTYLGDETAYDEALTLCDEAIELARTVGERPLIAQALNVKGELARVHGDDALARVAYEEGRDLAIESGDEAHLTIFLANLAYLARHDGDYHEARRLGCEALAMCWRLGRLMMAAWTISELAGAEVGLGRPVRGAVLVGAADEALQRRGLPRHPGDVAEHQGVVASLRSALGDEVYDSWHAEGSLLSLRQAVVLALDDSPRGAADADPDIVGLGELAGLDS